MAYAKAFFDLQVDFARTVAALSGLSLARSLFAYTNLFVRFGLGRRPDETAAGWQEYVAGIDHASYDHGRDHVGDEHAGDDHSGDVSEWTYRFYLRRAHLDTSPELVASVGCFGYARLDGDRVRLHFRDAETDGHAPLGIARRDRRIAELRALFAHAKRTEHQSVHVIGASWLYNLEAYRRLFPPSYLATAQVLRDRFQRMPLWGQFLDRHGDVNERMVLPFRERLRQQTSMAGLEQCFPFQVIGVEAPLRDFCDFYGA